MALREQLLEKQLSGTRNSSADVLDPHETASPYRRWPLGFRTLLRLRYLDLKKRVLSENRQALRYDTDPEEIQQEVLNLIRPLTGRRALWSFLLRSWVFYPLLIAAVAATAYFAFRSHQASLERSLFINDLPRYGDLVYRLKAAQSSESQASQSAEIQTELDTLRDKILNHFTAQPEITGAIIPLLDSVQRNDSMQPEVIGHTKQLNDQLFSNGIPYYVSAMSEIADCVHLPVESFLPRLFGGGESSEDTCVVHALLSFHVDEFRYYADGEVDHLAYFTRRIDGLEIYEGNVLGKVHIGDNTAQILLGNIEGASQDSLTAVNNGQIQSRLMPQGMPDVYGLESIARRLQSTVLEQYTTEFEQTWRWRMDRVRHRITGAKSGLLLAATEKLQRRTADVTAFHEVQHLIDQHQDLQEPDWFQDMLLSIGGSVPTNEAFQRHVLWELSAFFTHFAYGEELNGILLNEFTGITLDPMLQDQPHYYSIRILLPVLHAMYDDTLADGLPEPASTLGDVARSYKLLATNTDQLGQLARDAYRILFGRDIADIRDLMLKSNTVGTPGHQFK